MNRQKEITLQEHRSEVASIHSQWDSAKQAWNEEKLRMQNAMTKAIALKDRQLEEQRQEHARTVQQMLADHKN
jgi:hypothetical protein